MSFGLVSDFLEDNRTYYIYIYIFRLHLAQSNTLHCTHTHAHTQKRDQLIKLKTLSLHID
jgi:hypothetical protein